MSIRPNPFAPVTWLTTEGAAQALASDDDFFAKTDDGYLLRVEKMDRKQWWWQVYDPDGEEVIESPWMMETRDDAFTIAETVYALHRATQQK
ncbi:MAG: hypothetical protein KF905_02815 [Flavobacteriales bacterium]|nr:hypothetical protein [Flavobacteriales bacterium]